MCAIKHIITRRIQRNIPDQVDTDLIEARPEKKKKTLPILHPSPDPTTYMYVRV